MNTMTERADDREEIETLLPWHAAGTLSRRDAERVERALATDQELARRFTLVREELAETIHLNESLGAPSARAMEKLFAAIDAESAVARKPRFSFDLRTKVSEFFAGFGPRTVAFASGAAVLVILLQAGVIGGMLIKRESATGQFGTASYTEEPAKVESVDLYINFVPQATTTEVTKFLQAHDAKIVDGPKSIGTYVVRFAASGTPKEETARVMNEMKQSRNIVSSEFEAPLSK
ncbi:MAG TPA: hypothetical protein VLX44_03185 [Xanthobacteraceae bacterium]|nr:hypothetical protein [Xanthobacteraceae bacterium]